MFGSIRPQPFPRRNSIPRPPGFSRSKKIRPQIPRIFANKTRAQKFKRWASLLPSFAPIRVIRGHPVFPVTLFQFSFSVPSPLQFSVYSVGSVGSVGRRFFHNFDT